MSNAIAPIRKATSFIFSSMPAIYLSYFFFVRPFFFGVVSKGELNEGGVNEGISKGEEVFFFLLFIEASSFLTTVTLGI